MTDREAERVVRSTCRGCHGVCGVLVHLEDGRVTKVTGDPNCPTSNGYICAKGRAAVELLYHPDRLRFPLKRVGARGENRWQRISWDAALDTVADRFLKVKEEFGPVSIVGTQGTGRPYIVFYQRFLNALGTPNPFNHTHVCYFPRIWASDMTCGTLPVCDYFGFGGVYPKCVVNWGCNITETGAADGMCGYQETRTLNNGAKLIVIDPRCTWEASRAALWLQIRPGTDAALVLAVLYVLLTEDLADQDSIQSYSAGFNQLEDYVLGVNGGARSPQWAESICGVPAEEIIRFARAYAAAKPAMLFPGYSRFQDGHNQ